MPFEGQPQFGTVKPGVDYIDRPGVYALAIRDGRILIVETAAGSFLPGGGIDAGELPEAALRRELREEAGLSAAGFVEMGTARQYVIDSATGIGYRKIETFFQVTIAEQRSQPVELDHSARWVSVSGALTSLREPAQVWAVRLFVQSTSYAEGDD